MPAQRKTKPRQTASRNPPAASVPPTATKGNAATRLKDLLQALPGIVLETPGMAAFMLRMAADEANELAPAVGVGTVITSMAQSWGVPVPPDDAKNIAALAVAAPTGVAPPKTRAEGRQIMMAKINLTGGLQTETFYLQHPRYDVNATFAIRLAVLHYPRPPAAVAAAPWPQIRTMPEAIIRERINLWLDAIALNEKAPVSAPAGQATQQVRSASAEAEAMACLIDHPDWAIKEIAAAMHRHPKSFSRARMPKFMKTRASLGSAKNDIPTRRRRRVANGSHGLEAEFEHGHLNQIDGDENEDRSK